MSERSRAARNLAAALVLSTAALFPACARRTVTRADSATERAQAGSAATESIHPVAVVQARDGARWFSLDDSGITPVGGPALSSLTPFAPWPLARRLVGFVVRDGLIVGGANRDGFLAIVARKDGTAAVYGVFDRERFDPYSIGSIFLDGTTPVVLLHRDRFFEEPQVPAPDPRLFRLEDGAARPVGAALEALGGFDAAAGWDVEALERGSDGRWYARAARAGGSGRGSGRGNGDVAYASAPILHAAAEVSGSAAFQSSLTPRAAASADYVLARALRAAASLMLSGLSGVVLAIAPGQAGAIPYLLSAGGGADPVTRAWACSDGARAFLCLGDGTLVAAIGSDGPLLRSRLPELPAGFAYSGLAYTRGILAAAWEEQSGWAVGAAGFTLVDAQFFVDAAMAAEEAE